MKRMRPRDGVDGPPGPEGPGPKTDVVEVICDSIIEGWMTDPEHLESIKGPKGDQGPPGKDGKDGKDGNNGNNTTSNVLVGTVTLGETSILNLTLGVRKVTVSLPGTVVGGNYMVFPVSVTPAGYSIQEAVCSTAGQLTVSLLVPVISVLGSYSIPVRVVRIMT